MKINNIVLSALIIFLLTGYTLGQVQFDSERNLNIYPIEHKKLTYKTSSKKR